MWTHTDSFFIFLDSRNNALAMLFITRANSEDYSMNIFQHIIFCVIISVLPPITWFYSIIEWILDDCQVQLFTLEDVAICECDDKAYYRLRNISDRNGIDIFLIKCVTNITKTYIMCI